MQEKEARDESLAAQVAVRSKEAAFQAPVEQKVDKRGYAYNVALEQDPKAVLQTGAGVPGWRWREYSLTWSGPVGRDHTMRLFLLSPGMNRLLTVLRLGFVAVFGFVLLTGRWPALPRRRKTDPAAATSLLLVASLLALSPAAARAQQDPQQEAPSPDILQELRQRLTRPAPCEPRCVTTPSLVLRLGDSRSKEEPTQNSTRNSQPSLP